MRSKAKEKALKERQVEPRQWKHWRRERLEVLLQGPYGEAAQSLLAFLKSVAKPSELFDFIARGPWSAADADTSAAILALIDAAIVKRRESMGLAPFDDALPGAPSNLFLLLRERLAPSPEAKLGSIDSTAKIQDT